MERKDNNPFEKTVAYIVQMHQILKDMNIQDHTGAWLQFLHFNQKMDNQQKLARSLMDKITATILKQNNLISNGLIHSRVIYDLLAKAIWFPNDYQDFPSAAKLEVKKLIEYNSSRPINIPLVYLKTKNSSAKFGLIEICNIDEDDLKDEWWKKITNSGGTQESVQAYARVEVTGDHQNSLIEGRRIVEDMLIFLRAISFPITTKTMHQFGLLNEFPSLLLLPFKLGKPKENHKLEYSVQYSTWLGPATFPYELERDFLSKTDQKNIERINKLIEDDYFDPSSDLKRKLFLGLHWLGEATKPDTVESRFLKLFFSVESLIGGSIENLRNTREVLARRCSNIIGGKQKNRIYTKIIEYYIIRSKIVHGDKKIISEDDFSDFGAIVREVAFALLNKVDGFENIEDLSDFLIGPITQSRKSLADLSINDILKYIKRLFSK